MQMPTVGRIVHFYPPTDEPRPDRGDGPYAALVVEVPTDPESVEQGRVHLVTFGRGSTYFHDFVRFSNDLKADDACWTWPPKVGL